MAINITQRPFEYCFTGNPVFYELYSVLAAGDQSIFFQVRVLYKKVSDATFTTLKALEYDPDAGVAKVDIKDILDSILEYELPVFTTDEKEVIAAPKQTANFYLQFREITAANAEPSWDDSENDFIRFVVKGGINRYKFRGNNFWVNYFQLPYPFFTWQKSGRLASINERMYLAWLNDTNVLDGSISAVATVYYTDGTFAVVSKSFSTAKGVIYYIPAGAAQWGLADLDVNKTIYYWQITVNDYATGVDHGPLTEAFRYEADNRNDYNDITLHYRNSIGGLDSVRVRGVITKTLKYDRQQQQQNIAPDYYNGHYIAPAIKTAFSKEKLSWKGDIGHLPKEEQDRLRDMQLSDEMWLVIDRKWWPVNILTPDFTLNNSDDTRFHMPIEFTLADEGSESYTPDGAPLGDGVFTSNVCLATIGNVRITTSEAVPLVPGYLQALIEMDESDPQNASTEFRYKLTWSDGYEGWLTRNYGSFTTFVKKEDVTMLEMQSICTNNVLGRKTTLQIDTRSVPNGGTGGGGSTPTGNCRIVNYTSIGTNFTITIDAQVVANGYVGANGNAAFNVAPGYYRRVEVFLADLSPAAIVLYVTAPPQEPDYFFGGSAKFFDVTFTLDFSIFIS